MRLVIEKQAITRATNRTKWLVAGNKLSQKIYNFFQGAFMVAAPKKNRLTLELSQGGGGGQGPI